MKNAAYGHSYFKARWFFVTKRTKFGQCPAIRSQGTFWFATITSLQFGCSFTDDFKTCAFLVLDNF